MEVRNSVLNVKLHVNLAIKLCATILKSTSLDNGRVGDSLQLGVQARAAGGAEKVLVDLARSTGDVVGTGGSCEECSSCVKCSLPN